MSTIIDPALLDGVLQRWPVGRLATVYVGPADSESTSTMGAATRPHTVPIVFAPANGKLYSPIDGKPKSTANLQRLRNVRAHPRFSLLLDHYAEDWRALWWLRLDGTARVEQPIARQRRDIADALRTKYPQYQDTPVLRDDGLLLELDWHSVAGWAFAGDVNDQLRQL